jgi:hypothetical protein
MRPLRICACALTGLLLTGLAAGCASAGGQAHGGQAHGGQAHGGQAHPATGHLAGKLVMEGGPMGPGGQQPGERPMSGTVTVTSAGHQAVMVTVGSSGQFSVPLAPGRYQISGRSPDVMQDDGGHSRELPCSPPASVVVSAGSTATITLAPIVP